MKQQILYLMQDYLISKNFFANIKVVFIPKLLFNTF